MKLVHFASFPDKFRADVVAELLLSAGIKVDVRITPCPLVNLALKVSLYVAQDQMFLAEEALYKECELYRLPEYRRPLVRVSKLFPQTWKTFRNKL